MLKFFLYLIDKLRNVKKNLSILCAILIPFMLQSQEYEYIAFPDSGAIWSEVYYYPEPNWPDTVIKSLSYERFTLSGEDTVINELIYKKLYLFYDTIFNKTNAICIGGIREDEKKKVYFTGDSAIHAFKPCYVQTEMGNELLLFDFSLTIGDTLKLGNLSLWDGFIMVSSIDTVQIGNSLRKRFHFGDYFWVKWIEGIGSLKGLLFTSGDLPINGLNNDLICFKLNNEILYFNNDYDDCIPLIDGIEIRNSDNSTIKLFPNPAKDNIKFSFGEQLVSEIQIYDCNGRLYENYKIKQQSTFVLLTEKYQPGIYFYKATDKDGCLYTGKFVVQ